MPTPAVPSPASASVFRVDRFTAVARAFMIRASR